MTAHASDEPFLWNVAGLLGQPPGTERLHEVDGATLDLGATSGWPSRSPAACASFGPTGGSSPRPTCARRSPWSAAAACVTSRCPSTSNRTRSSCRRSTWRPATRCHRRRTRRPAPDRPSRARSGDPGPRGDSAGRADRATLPAGLSWLVRRVRRPPRRGLARSSGRRDRSAPGGPAWLQVER